jgi:pimeloyl-ACP methyl ester carboxylesterase
MKQLTLAGPQGQLVADDIGAGTAPAVVLVHADAGRRQQWTGALQHLGRTRRAAALDLRGHGASQFPANRDLSYEGRAADIAALLDVLAAERVVLVGHSGGAIAALTCATRHPSRVAGLVLLDPAGDPKSIPAEQRAAVMTQLRSENYREVLGSYYESVAGEDPGVRKRVIADALATAHETVVGTFEALNAFDPQALVGRYNGPTLVIVRPQTDQDWMLHRIGKLPYRVVESTGHWIQLEKPAEVNALLDEFLVAGLNGQPLRNAQRPPAAGAPASGR